MKIYFSNWQKVEETESVDVVLEKVCEELSPALTAHSTIWTEVYENENNPKLPFVNFTPHNAEVFIPTAESPFTELIKRFFRRQTFAFRRGRNA